jgi:Ca2+-transporting ATPase
MSLSRQKPVPAWRKFLAQFEDVLVILLLIATLVSVGLWLFERDTALPYEALAIFAVVLLNAIMGYIQQSRAEEAVAALTGESLPVSKDIDPITGEVGLGDRYNMVFSGTAATYGHGKAVVVATGMQTQMGRVAGMLKEAPTETTPLQRELDRVGKLLGFIVVVIAVVMIATIILVEEVSSFSGIFDVLILGVALAVAAVPEGLPAVVTAVLALGVQRMATRNAIVRHLAAVETLGSANVIASDKTGTLTKNEMTVRVVVTASGRVSLSGTGYAPEGEVHRDRIGAIAGNGQGAIDGALRIELERALTLGGPRQQC